MCRRTAPMPLDGVVELPTDDRPWEPAGILGRGIDGSQLEPAHAAAVYRDRIVAMGRKGEDAVAAQAGRLIIDHGDDALRWVLREREPSAARLRLVQCLEQAGLEGPVQVEAFG